MNKSGGEKICLIIILYLFHGKLKLKHMTHLSLDEEVEEKKELRGSYGNCLPKPTRSLEIQGKHKSNIESAMMKAKNEE